MVFIKKYFLLLLVLGCMVFSLNIMAQVQCKILPPAKIKMVTTVTEINNTNRDGVTRVHCIAEGIPHTSQRIDAARLFTDGKAHEATDIDGIDFERYFQWEDDGIIEFELDFPKQAHFNRNDSIQFITVHGLYSTKLGSAVTDLK